jgi:hypothetical protein
MGMSVTFIVNKGAQGQDFFQVIQFSSAGRHFDTPVTTLRCVIALMSQHIITSVVCVRDYL